MTHSNLTHLLRRLRSPIRVPACGVDDGAVVHNMLRPLGSEELFLEDLVVINTAKQRGQVNGACGGSAPLGTQSLT